MAKTSKRSAGRAEKRERKPNGKTGNGHTKAAKPKKTAAALSDEQMQTLLFAHKRKLRPLLEAEEAAKAAVKKAYDLASKEGVTKEDLKISFQLDTEEGEQAVKVKLERAARVARWAGSKIVDQLDLFGASKQSASEHNYADGRRAALNDQPCKPPSHLGQKASQDWMAGHGEGLKELNDSRAAGFKPLSDVVNKVMGDAAMAASLAPDTPEARPELT